MIRRITPLVTSAVLLSACANLNSVQYKYDSEHSSTILLDAKERAVNVYHGSQDQVCSEQAPDAFSVLATSLAASGQLSEPTGKSLGLNGSFSQSESGASLAFRTQLTQTEAQILYQLCAMAANGQISQEEVATQLRRLQHSLVALLAIEQLTGVAKPNIVAIGAGTSGSVGDQLASAQKQLDDATKTAATSKAAVDDAKKIVDTDTQAVTKSQTAVNSDADTVTKDKATLAAATGDDTKKAQTQLDTDTKTQQTDQAALADAQAKQKKDQDDLANKQSVADDADANVKAYTANRDALRSAVSTGSTAAAPAFNPSNTSAALSDQATASIASAVRDIVSMSTDNGYTDACLILITAGKLDYADKMDCTNHLMRADDYKEHYLAAYASLLTPSTPDTKNALNSVPAPNPEFRVAKAQNVVLSMRGLAPPPAAAPPPPPPPAAAPPPPPPLVPGKFLAFFDFDKADLRPDAKQVVDQAATYAKVKGRAVIDVTGHTDTSGAPDYNLALSQRRASAVSAELIASGIPANEIRVIAKGQSEPLVQTGDRVREPQNRRVEIVFD